VKTNPWVGDSEPIDAAIERISSGGSASGSAPAAAPAKAKDRKAMGGYKIGTTYGGLKYLGGDIKDQSNWEKTR
jgi:hypothetical protein